MKKNCTAYIIIFISYLFLATEGITDENKNKDILVEGILKQIKKYNGKPGPFSYKLNVEIIPYSEYEGVKKKERELIGWDVGPPIVIVKGIKFKLADYLLEFPKSSFDDLCRIAVRNDEFLPVTINDENIVITLCGGDASSYYKVRFILKIDKKSLALTKREVTIYPPWDFSNPDDVKNL
ncbi:MAG: hypothetical protein GY795_02240 [Desulfobacterales bacterium]|nr:hypothetical protein [Desulfobacterales bacterium]